MTLESLAIERAAPNVTAEALREIERSLSRLAAAAHRPDLTCYHRSDMDFHKVIWRLFSSGKSSIAWRSARW